MIAKPSVGCLEWFILHRKEEMWQALCLSILNPRTFRFLKVEVRTFGSKELSFAQSSRIESQDSSPVGAVVTPSFYGGGP